MKTRIIKVLPGDLRGHFVDQSLNSWAVTHDPSDDTIAPLREAASYLLEKDVPVAFPTETVYGLGADATRSSAVKGIYTAKGRPSDNPLIVHVCDLSMLRSLLRPSPPPLSATTNGSASPDPIPSIYHPLIQRFWPGPLTILLRLPQPPYLSKIAPEVTAGLSTFGARMPSSPLALSLISLTGRPLAAPSANASTKPSPTTAQHVLDDLAGRIELILDGGGTCQVGVESTVVDGLCDPPVVLRPGGVSMDEIRAVPGWESVVQGYMDASEVGNNGNAAPKAPGMKYKHYSPEAKVVLYEAGRQAECLGIDEVRKEVEQLGGRTARCVNGYGGKTTVGVIRTRRWKAAGGLESCELRPLPKLEDEDAGEIEIRGVMRQGELEAVPAKVLDVNLGQDTRRIAHGLFSALRALDKLGADVIFVEGIADGVDIAEAVMNRLRKAATEIRS